MGDTNDTTVVLDAKEVKLLASLLPLLQLAVESPSGYVAVVSNLPPSFLEVMSVRVTALMSRLQSADLEPAPGQMAPVKAHVVVRNDIPYVVFLHETLAHDAVRRAREAVRSVAWEVKKATLVFDDEVISSLFPSPRSGS